MVDKKVFELETRQVDNENSYRKAQKTENQTSNKKSSNSVHVKLETITILPPHDKRSKNTINRLGNESHNSCENSTETEEEEGRVSF